MCCSLYVRLFFVREDKEGTARWLFISILKPFPMKNSFFQSCWLESPARFSSSFNRIGFYLMHACTLRVFGVGVKQLLWIIAFATNVWQILLAVIKPINLQSRLRLNPHPHNDLSKPKIVLDLDLEEIGLRLLQEQYHGAMELVDSMDRMVLNAPFRKFRPAVALKADKRAWWVGVSSQRCLLFCFNFHLLSPLKDKHEPGFAGRLT